MSNYYKASFLSKGYAVFIQRVMVILLLVFVVWFSFLRAIQMNTFTLKSEGKDVYTHENTLIFEDEQNGQEFLRVSPFDDYIYSGKIKQHIGERGKVRAIDDIQGYGRFFQGFFVKPSHVSLNIVKKDTKEPLVAYEVLARQGKQFVLSRRITDERKNITAVGQAYVICYGCIVTDNQGYAYFNYELLAEKKEAYAKSLGLVVFSIHRGQPLPGVGFLREIVIRDGVGRQLYGIHLHKDDIVFYDEKYRLLEIKRPLEPHGVAETLLTF